MADQTADRHQRRIGRDRSPPYGFDMDFFLDSTLSDSREAGREASVGALLALALVLVLAAASAGLLVAGA